MSVAEMKIAVINKITNTDDETVLKQVLALLTSDKATDANSLSKNYDVIKEQYGTVLKKLAQ